MVVLSHYFLFEILSLVKLTPKIPNLKFFLPNVQRREETISLEIKNESSGKLESKCVVFPPGEAQRSKAILIEFSLQISFTISPINILEAS